MEHPSEPPEPPDLAGFDRVDESRLQPFLIDYLERVGRRPDMRRVDEIAVRMLRIGPGDQVLEVASGLGDDAIELARIVGPSGHVVGVDLSADLLALARRRAEAAGVRVEFRVGDMQALDLGDEVFHGVRVERALQYLPDPGAVVRELARVTRPGGHVVAAEPDWGSLAVNLEDTELLESSVATWAAMLRASRFHPRMGLQLPGHLRRAGLVDIEVELVTIIGRSRADAGEVLPMLATDPPPELVEALAAVPDHDRWERALDEADAVGGLVATLQMWIVGGRKP